MRLFWCGDLAIERHRILSDDQRQASLDVMEEHFVDRATFIQKCIFNDLDTCLAQDLEALACHERIRIRRTHHHARDARLDDSFRARRRLSPMTAGFERHVDGRATWVFRAMRQRLAFGMKLTIGSVPALTNDAAIFHDNSSHLRIRVGPASTARCQFERTRHVTFMLVRALRIFTGRIRLFVLTHQKHLLISTASDLFLGH